MADYCENCGAKIDENTHDFCSECGANLKTPEIKQKKFFDKNKDIITILVVIIAIGIVFFAATYILTDSADDDSYQFDYGTQTVNINNVQFKIPGDYRLNPTSIDYEYENYVTTYSQTYSNGEETITFSVISSPGVDVPASEVVEQTGGGVTKNMCGRSGTYMENSDGYGFIFGEGNKLCGILVSSPYVFDQIEIIG